MLKLFKKFNDLFAIVVVALIFIFWILQGKGIITDNQAITGATITVLTTVVFFYFRKAPPAGTPPTGGVS